MADTCLHGRATYRWHQTSKAPASYHPLGRLITVRFASQYLAG